MTDEPTMKLYATAFSAQRESDGQVTLRIAPGIVLALSEAEAHKEGMGGAFAAFPESEGWTDHQVTLTEIPNGLVFENYHLTWQAEKNS